MPAAGFKKITKCLLLALVLLACFTQVILSKSVAASGKSAPSPFDDNCEDNDDPWACCRQHEDNNGDLSDHCKDLLGLAKGLAVGIIIAIIIGVILLIVGSCVLLCCCCGLCCFAGRKAMNASKN